MSVFSTFIIRQHRPYLYASLVLIIIALTALIQHYIYLKATQVQQEQIKQHDQLNDSYRALLLDNNDLSNKLALSNNNLDQHKYEIEVQQATIIKLEQALGTLQEQLTAQNKELLFYQLITQVDRSNELQISEPSLRADSTDPAVVHYQLVITQGAKFYKPLTGKIEIRVNTLHKGRLDPVFLTDHPLNLRHVQLIEGQIQLTEKILPENITIVIMQNKKELLSRSFNWQLSPPPE